MSRSKSDIIRDVSDQFVKNLTGEYFQGKSAQIDTIINNSDHSVVNRLLDKIKIDPTLVEELFNLTTNAADPIKQVIEPLIAAIANRMFEGWVKKDLRSNLKNNIPRYDELVGIFEDPQQFQTTWLRAIAATCSALLTDKLTAKLDVMMQDKMALSPEKNEEREKIRMEMEETSQRFANAITKPFDNYFNKIQTPILLYPTWLRYLYQGFLRIMSVFSRDKNLTIEEKIDGLYLAADAALTKIKEVLASMDETSPEAQSFLAVSEELEGLKNNLNSLATEINDKKEANWEYEDYAQNAFQGFTQKFANFIRAQQTQQTDQLQDISNPVLNEVISALLNKNPILAKLVVDGQSMTPKATSVDNTSSPKTSIDYSPVPSEDSDTEEEERRTRSISSSGKN